MEHRVSSYMYMLSENFNNIIRLQLVLKENIDFDILKRALDTTVKRYPYFCVKLEIQDESYVLTENKLPMVICKDDELITIGSKDSNYHLVAVSYKDNKISVISSHFFVDAKGMFPFTKTLLYYYLLYKYKEIDVDIDRINKVEDEINKEEYEYPIPKEHIKTDKPLFNCELTDCFNLPHDNFAPFCTYKYHLNVKKSDVIPKMRDIGSSPAGFFISCMYEAIIKVHPDCEKDVVCSIPHTFKECLGKSLVHDSLLYFAFVPFPKRMKDMEFKWKNTCTRGRIILLTDTERDNKEINMLVDIDKRLDTLTLEEKKKAIFEYGTNFLHTFDVTYPGNLDYAGLDKYLDDVYIFTGENSRDDCEAVYIMPCDDHFSIDIAQPGKGGVYINAFSDVLKEKGIDCNIVGQEEYKMNKFKLPEK